jgi:hypothetical protein
MRLLIVEDRPQNGIHRPALAAGGPLQAAGRTETEQARQHARGELICRFVVHADGVV